MKYTPFGYIESWTAADGRKAWRGKFDPMPAKEPALFGEWQHARTEKKLVAKLRTMCKAQMTHCSVALEYDEENSIA